MLYIYSIFTKINGKSKQNFYDNCPISAKYRTIIKTGREWSHDPFNVEIYNANDSIYM